MRPPTAEFAFTGFDATARSSFGWWSFEWNSEILADEALDDRHSAADAKGFRGDAQAWSGLLTFPLVQIHSPLHPADCRFLKPPGNDFIGGELMFHVEFEDAIKNFVGWECVLVLLVRAEFCAGGLVNRVPRDDFAFTVDPVRYFIDFNFRQI